MDENLIKMENFFNTNLKIKDLMRKIAPCADDGANQDSLFTYVAKFLQITDEIKNNLLNTLSDLGYGEDIKNLIQKNFKEYERKILSRIQGYHDIKTIYEECCSKMSEDLVNRARNELIGYLYYSDNVYEVFSEAKTINEMTHVLHSAVVNDENYYKSMPIICEKENNDGYPITLYGRENALSQSIFNTIPKEMSCGDTDIVALENNILMMVRDRGHALSIQIEVDTNDNIWVKYFIPKICNVDMVNLLRGVNKVDKTSRFTTGYFSTTKENLAVDVIDFINGVPMDKDMVFDFLGNNLIVEINGKSK